MYAKSEVFELELQEMAKIAKALSHPARIAILKYLAEQQTCISGDISNEIPLSRTTVSQHLQELKKAGLIKGTIDGLKVNYCVCNSCMKKVKAMFDRFFSNTVTDKDNC
jgi:DNA-binding transcriptional ArsR family regulator